MDSRDTISRLASKEAECQVLREKVQKLESDHKYWRDYAMDVIEKILLIQADFSSLMDSFDEITGEKVADDSIKIHETWEPHHK